MSVIFVFATGFILAMGFGPIFFSIVQGSIEKGWKFGASIALGTCSSDLLMAFGVFILFKNQKAIEVSPSLKLLGGLILFLFGIYQFKKKKEDTTDVLKKETHKIKYFIKGAFLNLGNPINYVNWFTITLVLRSFKLGRELEMIHLAGIIAVIFTIQLSISILLARFQDRFTPKFILRMRIVVGVIFIVAAIKLISMVPLSFYHWQ